MNKSILVILYVHLLTALYSLTPVFNLQGEFWSQPYFYEGRYRIAGGSFNGRLEGGVKLDKFTVGLALAEEYLTYTGNTTGYSTNGAANKLKGLATFSYTPLTWFTLRVGLGAAWYSTSLDLNNKGYLNTHYAGLSLAVEEEFGSFKDIFLVSQINRLDLFFGNGYLLPDYYGAIRFGFNPGVNWLILYLETGVKTWVYRDTTTTMQSAAFMASCGIKVSLDFPGTPAYMRDKRIAFIEKRNSRFQAGETKTRDEESLEGLLDAKKGDTFTFTGIIFYADSDTIKEESYPLMEQIAAALEERKDLIVEIGGYTNSIGDPQAELELSIKRAMRVVAFLTEKGINGYRMKAAGYGGLTAQGTTINEENRKVVITVIDIAK